MRNPTTDDVLRDMDQAFAREEAERRRLHAEQRERTRKMCDGGMLDDVTPSGPPPTDTMTVTCGFCGAVLTGPVYTPEDDWLTAHLDTCSARVR